MKLILVLLLLLSSVVLVHSVDAKSKGQKTIDKSIARAVEGKWNTIDMVNISKINDSASIVVYNKTVPVPPTPQPTPEPTPTPTSGYKLCMAGDFKDSSVFDAMKSNGCNYRIALGDMGYSSSLSLLKSIKPDKCVIGNHDAPEDGSSAIYKEALAYCGNSWWLKPVPSVLILGFNTNGDVTTQLNAAKDILFNSQNMQNVKTVIALSHKNGHVFPNAHHPAEAVDLYSQLESNMPNGVTLWEASGHNHDSASAPAKHWYIAGMGGKSSYTCGIDADWTFCDNSHNAYLQFTIDNQGKITPNFIDTSGKILN